LKEVLGVVVLKGREVRHDVAEADDETNNLFLPVKYGLQVRSDLPCVPILAADLIEDL